MVSLLFSLIRQEGASVDLRCKLVQKGRHIGGCLLRKGLPQTFLKSLGSLECFLGLLLLPSKKLLSLSLLLLDLKEVVVVE